MHHTGVRGPKLYKNFKHRNEYSKFRTIETSRALTKTNIKLPKGIHPEYTGLCRKLTSIQDKFTIKNDDPLEKNNAKEK